MLVNRILFALNCYTYAVNDAQTCCPSNAFMSSNSLFIHKLYFIEKERCGEKFYFCIARAARRHRFCAKEPLRFLCARRYVQHNAQMHNLKIKSINLILPFDFTNYNRDAVPLALILAVAVRCSNFVLSSGVMCSRLVYVRLHFHASSDVNAQIALKSCECICNGNKLRCNENHFSPATRDRVYLARRQNADN